MSWNQILFFTKLSEYFLETDTYFIINMHIYVF